MSGLRADIAAAVSRMQLTFGTRTAIKNLHESLEEGEIVQRLVACTYDRSDGLLVLTDRRVLAIRDDFSRFRLQEVRLADARAIDYDPTVHDGLAVLTADSRVAVRRMVRVDSDAFVVDLTARVPGLVHGVSRPGHRVEVPKDVPPPAAPATPEPAADHGPTPVIDATPVPAPVPAPTPAVESAPAPAADPVVAAVETDTEVLLGVLADLHAKGLLTADELAAKIAQVTTRS